MHCFKVALVALADRLFDCSHRKTSFPITRRTSVSADGQRNTHQAETYIVCLECGRHFKYDWTTMRVTGLPAHLGRRRSGSDRISNKNSAFRSEPLLPQAANVSCQSEGRRLEQGR